MFNPFWNVSLATECATEKSGYQMNQTNLIYESSSKINFPYAKKT